MPALAIPGRAQLAITLRPCFNGTTDDPTGKSVTRSVRWRSACPVPSGKISDFPKYQIIGIFSAVPSHREGRLAIVTDAGRDAVDAEVPITNGAEADGEVVWS